MGAIVNIMALSRVGVVWRVVHGLTVGPRQGMAGVAILLLL